MSNAALEIIEEHEPLVKAAILKAFAEEPNDHLARWVIICREGVYPLYNAATAIMNLSKKDELAIKAHIEIARAWNEEGDIEGVEERLLSDVVPTLKFAAEDYEPWEPERERDSI